jgi:hypothetical protein
VKGLGAQMANKEHVRRLREGVAVWNSWRYDNREIRPDLSNVDIGAADLQAANLVWTNLQNSNLAGATLDHADLSHSKLDHVNLSGGMMRAVLLGATSLKHANLSQARLINTIFDVADLTGANLDGATLYGTNFKKTRMKDVDLSHSDLRNTIFADVDLSTVIGLETCRHTGPSIVDHRTLQKSTEVPLVFLRGIGLPENLIDYLPSIFNIPILHHSCFISYSTKNQDFADHLYSGLQNKGVRCWFAPHDMPIGGIILDEIDSAIRLRDKVLLILSEHSIKSDWVEDEVTKAFEEERKHNKTLLFPIRLDDAVMDTNEAWAAKLRARHIGDFTRWKEHDEYQKSFARVLRDLTVKTDAS